MANPTVFGVLIMGFSILGTIAAFVYLILLAAQWPWEYVDFNNAGGAVANSHWQWIYVAPVFCMLVGIMGLIAGIFLWRNSGNQLTRRTLMMVFGILALVMLTVAAAVFGAWIMRMHIFEHTASTLLSTNNCLISGDFQTSTCGSKAETNDNYLAYQLTQYFVPVLVIGIASFVLLLVAGVLALLIFILPLEAPMSPMSPYPSAPPAPMRPGYPGPARAGYPGRLM